MTDGEPAPAGFEAPPDPWERYGWLTALVWLVFLVFPLGAAVAADLHWTLRVLACLLIVVFAVVYSLGFIRLDGTEATGQLAAKGWRYVLALVALMGTITAIIGLEALGMMPFVVAASVFLLPLSLGLVVSAVAVLATAVVPILVDGADGLWFLSGITVLVGVVTAVVRVLDRLGSAHRRLSDELAVIAERDRVARDVHDVLGHSLTVITVKAELAERLVEADPGRARDEMAQVQDLSRQALGEIRSTVGGLRSARLADEIDAAREALDGAGIASVLPADPSVVEPRHRIPLAWALREAVTNVVRHSAAQRCTVEIGPDWLTVVDDGRGMNGRTTGHGLRGLRERIAVAGGTLEVGAADDGAGTRVRVQL